MNKYCKIYKVLECQIDVPINDIDAWKIYPEYRFIYNKIFIAEYQGLKNAPMPIKPEKYPVIIKPIINIYGMGLNIIKINNEDEFLDNWFNNNFWMEFLEGDHLSFDIIILNGSIQFHTCFKGYKADDLGEFIYWESVDEELSKVFKNLINDKFSEYTGILNIETIGNKIIECHLRMGDIDIFPTLDILRGIIEMYKKNEYNWKDIKLNKVFFFPLWVNISEKEHEDLKEYLESNIYDSLDNNPYIYNFEIDSIGLAYPSKNKRVLSFSCNSKEYGFLLIDSLRQLVEKSLKCV